MVSGQAQFIIGLTGNIGTGKTVVRRMLEHLGAYTIDADGLARRATAKGAPGYDPVVTTFGQWILSGNDEIDRQKLGDLVFRDADALVRLEKIVHPLVRQAVDLLVRRSTRSVVVVEAIKLLEGELHKKCDSIWVTYAPPAMQLDRLIHDRGLAREDAQRRIAAQGPQTDKIAAADVVIRNTGSYDDLWRQVEEAWRRIVPSTAQDEPSGFTPAKPGGLGVSRGRPKDAPAIASFISRLAGNGTLLTADDIMAQFGEKAYMLLMQNRVLVGVSGWQVENLVVRTTDLYIEPGIDVGQALEVLIPEIEAVSAELQCEASLVFPRKGVSPDAGVWAKLGYEQRRADELGVQAWVDAAKESMPADTVLQFKQMRKDRILRPI